MIAVDTGPQGVFNVSFHAIDRWKLRFKSNSPMEADVEVAAHLVQKLLGSTRVSDEYYARKYMLLVCVERTIITVMWPNNPETKRLLKLAKVKKEEIRMEIEEMDGRYLFSAAWCGQCTPIKARITEDSGVKVIDVDENMEIARQLGVKALPTLVVMEQGKLKEKHIGAQASGAAL